MDSDELGPGSSTSIPPISNMTVDRVTEASPSDEPREGLGRTLLRTLQLLITLYVFLYSIQLLGGTFKLLGEDFATSLIQTTTNPFASLLIGIVATSLVQSSSTVTSLIVGLVAGGALTVDGAIPMVMGANIGTSVTNTIVALGHMTRPQEFQRAFAGATVHDFFNIMAVAVFLPLELATGFLKKSADWATDLLVGSSGVSFESPLKAIVKPATKATEHLALDNISNQNVAAAVLIVLSLAVLFLSLHFLVKLMKKLVLGRVELLMDRYVFQHALVGIVTGMAITVLVQSSSVTTSLTVPLLAAGFCTVEQIFPVVLGANAGTTVTAMLASLATGSTAALSVALVHLFFNIYGIIAIYPFRQIPISMAKTLARLSLRSRWVAVGYVLVVFFALPLTLILLTK